MSYTHTKWDGGESINRRKRKEKRCEIYKEAGRIPQGKQKISSRSPCAVVIRFWTLVKDGASCPISTGFLWWPHHAVKVSRTDIADVSRAIVSLGQNEKRRERSSHLISGREGIELPLLPLLTVPYKRVPYKIYCVYCF